MSVYGTGTYGSATYGGGGPVPEPVEPLHAFRRPTQTPGVPFVRLQALDGMWETVGADRLRGVRAEGLQATANRWGSDTCRFTLKRPPGGVFPDLTAFTPIEIYNQYGTRVWTGRIKETPSTSGGEFSIGVEGLGWQYHLDDDVYERTYVHSRLGDWKDQRSFLDANLTVFNAAGQVEAGSGAIVLGQAKGTRWDGGKAQGVTLDLGPDSAATRVVIATEQINLNGSGVFTMYIRGTDTPDAVPSSGYNELVVAATSGVAGTFPVTFGTPRRYVHIFLFWTGAGGDTGADHLLRITSAKVFRDTAYESGNESVFRAHHGIADALQFAPLLSQDTSLISETLFNIPDFSLTDDRKPREVMEALNALHNYRLRVTVDRKLEFAPQPDKPIYRVGPWSGADFKDASKNSGDEIYNRSLIRGSGADGGPVKVNRYAGQQVGVAREIIASPAVNNPSFTVNTSGWTGVTRSTAEFDTSPASGLIASGATAVGAITGTFRAGATYMLEFAYKVDPGGASSGSTFVLRFGDGADAGELLRQLPLDFVFNTRRVAWTPRANTSAGQIVVEVIEGDDLYIDSFSISIARPTLPDRRSFVRAHTHSMSQALVPEIATQIADTFLLTHKRTPLKGDITVKGRHGLRRMQGDATVPPSELLANTGELIHLADQVDPDTGALGRDAPIDSVTWSADDDTASVALDAQRDNLAALLARYEGAAGAA